MSDAHEYLSDDRDVEANRLRVYQGDNGDWYVVVLKPGERIGTAVRITTSGVRRGLEGVAPAVRRLYDALKPAPPEHPQCTGWAASWCPNCGNCTCPFDAEGRDTGDDLACPLHGSAAAHPIEGSEVTP